MTARAIYQLLIINSTKAIPLVADVYDISNLKNEKDVTPGIFLLFNSKNVLSRFGCSYDNVIEHAINNSHDESIYGYYIISDVNNPLSSQDIDDIYENILEGYFHIAVLGKEAEIPIDIILN